MHSAPLRHVDTPESRSTWVLHEVRRTFNELCRRLEYGSRQNRHSSGGAIWAVVCGTIVRRIVSDSATVVEDKQNEVPAWRHDDPDDSMVLMRGRWRHVSVVK